MVMAGVLEGPKLEGFRALARSGDIAGAISLFNYLPHLGLFNHRCSTHAYAAEEAVVDIVEAALAEERVEDGGVGEGVGEEAAVEHVIEQEAAERAWPRQQRALVRVR